MIQVAAICHVFTGRVFRVPTMILIGAAAAMVVLLGYIRIVVTEQGQAAQALMSGDRRDAMAVLLDNSITRTRGVEAVIAMNDYMEHAPFHYFGDNLKETATAIVPSFLISRAFPSQKRSQPRCTEAI